MTEFDYRPATRADSRAIAALFQISSDGVADYIWTLLARPGESLLDVGERRYARDGVDFSFENCLVATHHERVVGMLHSFAMASHDDDQDENPDPILRPYAELEVPGSLYISGVATLDSVRGRGIGTVFLERAVERARTMNLDKLSLIVFEQNQGAKRLYERHGYHD